MKDLHSETVLYESPSLSIADYRCRRPAENRPSGEEQALAHVIALPRSGLFLRHQRGEVVVADLNQVLFYNRGETYRIRHPLPGGDRCTTLRLSPELLLSVLAEVDPEVEDRPPASFRFGHVPASPAVTLHHYRLLQLVRCGLGELGVEEITTRIAVRIVAEAHRHFDRPARRDAPSERRQRALVDAAREILAADCARRIGLVELAEEVGCSPSHLSRIFHRSMGLPLHRYQLRLRLRTAVDRLAEGGSGESLTELALELGFFDHSHFSNAFRRELGLPPSEWRRLTRRSGRHERARPNCELFA